MKSILLLLVLCVLPLISKGEGSVIFIHPDGTGLGHWHAGRLMMVGPDGQLNWDKLERAAVYRAHQKYWLATTSHAGGTVHAYGKKVPRDSYGMHGQQPLISASGSPMSIMQEAIAAGIPSGVVNSGHIGEPGTGVFLASSKTRKDVQGIAAKIIHSGAEVMLFAGEIHLLPKGKPGRHGEPGEREDGRNLIQEAVELGYTVIFTREQLLNLDPNTDKVLGIFAAHSTFTNGSEDKHRELGVSPYQPGAPTFAEMTRKAIEILSKDPEKPFFLVAEEEGTDNYSNAMNAGAMLEAVKRSDEAIGVALEFMRDHPDRKVLTLTAADSDAGNPSVWAPKNLPANEPLPPVTNSGAALDGITGAQSKPFVSAPDALGKRHAFGIAWPFGFDMQGSVVAKAHGYASDRLPVDLDNTGIYTLMHSVLFED